MHIYIYHGYDDIVKKWKKKKVYATPHALTDAFIPFYFLRYTWDQKSERLVHHDQMTHVYWAKSTRVDELASCGKFSTKVNEGHGTELLMHTTVICQCFASNQVSTNCF